MISTRGSNQVPARRHGLAQCASLPSKKPSKKLDHKYQGPYRVVRKVGASAYQLTTQGQSARLRHSMSSSSSPTREGAIPHRSLTPPPPVELKDGEDEWEVESVKDLRYSRGQLQYLVH